MYPLFPAREAGKKRKTADASGLDSFSMSVEKSDLVSID